MRLRKTITRLAQNLPGWRTARKVVVIESDDWGSIRMPSKEIYEHLLKKGYRVDRDPFMKYDSLASEQDLQELTDVLMSVKDRNGNYAKLTLNTIMANPDFQRIREDGFRQYHYELFTDTLNKYPNHKKSFQLWQEGINTGIFKPQFHGREHLNVDRWMDALRNNENNITEAFRNQMISISSEPSELTFSYMEALDYFSQEGNFARTEIIREGLNLFEKLFGFTPQSFMACCFIWDDPVEEQIHSDGIKYIQGIARQSIPYIRNGNHRHRYKYHYTGQRNRYDQIYLVRNATFEPSFNANTDWVDHCLAEIKIAFMLNKPAIVSSHRLNFIGSIDIRNRETNLRSFRRLLKAITDLWPDVEFMFSDEIGMEIKGQEA